MDEKFSDSLTVLMMGLTLFLASNFSRVLYMLPFALLMSVFIALIWIGIPRKRLNEVWNRFTTSLTFPRSLVVITVWTLMLTLLPACLTGHFPKPVVHDEFSYLLGAETFRLGRLTNPSPSNWEHFESYHITVQPTYQTKYQPGMSLMLAVGLWLANDAYLGVVLALVLASLALTWMIQLWLPRRWALPMTLLAVVVMVGNWGNNYFVAGPLATLAGSLQLGILRRWSHGDVHHISWMDGVLWGLSLVILAWTRPFEGLLFSVLIGAALLLIVLRQGTLRQCLLRTVPGLALTLLPAAWFQLEYNQAITGSRFTFPYFVHDKQYFISPPFLFQPLNPEPVYRHDVIRQFHQSMVTTYEKLRSLNMLPVVLGFRFGFAWVNFGLLLWLIPMMVFPEIWHRRESRRLMLFWFSFLLMIQLVSWFLPHYAAPAWPAWWIVIATGIRILRRWKWQGKQSGRFIVCLLIATTCCYAAVERILVPLVVNPSWISRKVQVSEQLLAQGPRHLVLVHYGADHDTGEEWVYNGADLQNQAILWARFMDEAHNQDLIRNYAGRSVWLLQVNRNNKQDPIQLQPYQPGHKTTSP